MLYSLCDAVESALFGSLWNAVVDAFADSMVGVARSGLCDSDTV